MNDADDPEEDRADEIITLLQKPQRLPVMVGMIEDFRFNICHLSFVIVLQASGSMVNVKSQMENDKWYVLANSFLVTNRVKPSHSGQREGLPAICTAGSSPRHRS